MAEHRPSLVDRIRRRSSLHGNVRKKCVVVNCNREMFRNGKGYCRQCFQQAQTGSPPLGSTKDADSSDAKVSSLCSDAKATTVGTSIEEDVDKELWVSVDIEGDGPSLSKNSMISAGLVVYLYNSQRGAYTELLKDAVCVDMKPDPGHVPDPATEKWWLSPAGNAAEYARLKQVTTSQREGAEQIKAWFNKMKTLTKRTKCVLLAYPTLYDGEWLDHLFVEQLGHRLPCFFDAYDIRSFAAAAIKAPYVQCKKGQLLKPFQDPKAPHTHNALVDAVEQGRLFCNLHAHVFGHQRPF